MFNWTDEAIRFMEDACRRTDFHEHLTAMLLPHLSGASRVCDAGCGLGYLTLTLAPHVAHVTAAERDDRALDVLRRELTARCITNVTPLCTDVLTYVPPEKFDAMVFCFFGSMEEILSAARAQCRGTVLAVVRDDARHRFSGAPRGADRPALEVGEPGDVRGLRDDDTAWIALVVATDDDQVVAVGAGHHRLIAPGLDEVLGAGQERVVLPLLLSVVTQADP